MHAYVYCDCRYDIFLSVCITAIDNTLGIKTSPRNNVPSTSRARPNSAAYTSLNGFRANSVTVSKARMILLI